MKNWINNNKSWLFSGVAIYLLGLISGPVKDSLPLLNSVVSVKIWLLITVSALPALIMASVLYKKMKMHEIELSQIKAGHAENKTELEQQAFRDPLTGLFNLRQLKSFYSHDFQKLEGKPNGISGLLVDVDNFSSFQMPPNTFRQGSDLLKQVANVLSKRVSRPSDFLVKYGGDEFLILVVDTPPAGVVRFAELIQKWIAEEHFYMGNSDERVFIRVSIGVTKFNSTSDTPERFEDRLYFALKEAKDKPGKNSIAVM